MQADLACPSREEDGCGSALLSSGDASPLSVSCLLPVPSGPPSTTILASSSRVGGGEDVSVLCTVLGEPDVEVEFRWVYPGQKVSTLHRPGLLLIQGCPLPPSDLGRGAVHMLQ